MNKDWFSTYALLWMVLSLMLLLGVLIFWNVENYNNEKEDLASVIDYNAQLAIGEVRDSVFQIFVNTISTDKNGNTNNTNINVIVDTPSVDSVSVSDSMFISIFDYLDKETLSSVGIDSSIVLQINDPQTELSMTSGELGEKSITILQNRLKDRGLPHLLINDKLSEIDLAASSLLKTNSELRFFLLKKIWPSILVSLLLFLAICGTYFIIYRSWKNQQKINQFKNEFVSNMTHELKTPLSTVGVALEALDNFGVANDPLKTKEYIEISKHEVNRLNILVDKVLKMSMSDKGMLKLNQERIDLENTITSILAAMKLHFEKQEAKVTFHTSGKEFNIKGDSIHITNVIYNLLDNGIKYSNVKPELVVNLNELNEVIEVSIQDNGIGIEQEDIHKIFSQFYRVPSDNIHNVKGYGLGLNYVKSIVEEHNGSIHVDSSLGHGSTFTLTFPKLTA